MFIVALPFGVLHGGYWAILAMVGISHICCHTGKILVECLYEADESGNTEPVKIRFSYKEIAQAVFGGNVGGYMVLGIVFNFFFSLPSPLHLPVYTGIRIFCQFRSSKK